MWKNCLDCLNDLLDILFANPDMFIGENIAEDSENLVVSEQVSGCFWNYNAQHAIHLSLCRLLQAVRICWEL